MKYTDKELLDFLEEENSLARYTGVCRFDVSEKRGWRLYETSCKAKASDTVREAIERAIDESVPDEPEPVRPKADI